MIHPTVVSHHLQYSLKIVPDPVEIPENYNFSQEAWAAVIYDIKGKGYFICVGLDEDDALMQMYVYSITYTCLSTCLEFNCV